MPWPTPPRRPDRTFRAGFLRSRWNRNWAFWRTLLLTQPGSYEATMAGGTRRAGRAGRSTSSPSRIGAPIFEGGDTSMDPEYMTLEDLHGGGKRAARPPGRDRRRSETTWRRRSGVRPRICRLDAPGENDGARIRRGPHSPQGASNCGKPKAIRTGATRTIGSRRARSSRSRIARPRRCCRATPVPRSRSSPSGRR